MVLDRQRQHVGFHRVGIGTRDAGSGMISRCSTNATDCHATNCTSPCAPGRTGTVYFGGHQRFGFFPIPTDVRQKDYSPSVHLTESGFRISPWPSAPIPRWRSRSPDRGIRLGPQQNDISLYLCRPGFRPSRAQPYRFRLEPQDADWRNRRPRHRPITPTSTPGPTLSRSWAATATACGTRPPPC